ncbi:Glycogen synthase [Porphyromonas levii]|uniref:glycogen/starch synthase n=1 Tax=Porphyromonas levii TaxID=28114 RepID=UPI001BA8CA72|nr:Glycogen synthase [Porphyromonas levii]
MVTMRKKKVARKKVLYLAQEIYPYLEDSPVGKDSKLIPLGILERGNDIRTFMPNYGVINERRNQLHEVIRLSGVNLTVNDKVHQLIIKVASLMPQRMQVYFIDNDDFFGRKGVFTESDGTYYQDNVERAVFFIRGVFETVKKLRWIPDIIHCQGWFTGLAPLYLRTMLKDDPALSRAKIVYSAYDTAPEFPFDDQLTGVLGYDNIKHPLLDGNKLDREALVKLILEYVDGIIYSEANASDELKNVIKNSGIKALNFESDDKLIETVADFYTDVIGRDEEEDIDEDV